MTTQSEELLAHVFQLLHQQECKDEAVTELHRLVTENQELKGMREEVLHYQREFHRLRDVLEVQQAVLKDVGLFLHHCWCDVQMNEYSFEKLNTIMQRVDAIINQARSKV